MTEQTIARRAWLILLALFAAEVAEAAGGTMVFAALPRLMREYGNPIAVGWLVTGNSLIATSAALMAGRIGQMFGVRRVMLAFIACSLAGSTLAAFAPNLAVLLAGRSLQGVGAAVFPLSIILLRAHFPPSRVPFGIGVLTSAASVGTASGLVIGGLVIDNFDWHWMFGACSLLLVVAWLLARLFVPADGERGPVARVDLVDGALPVPAICAILLGASLSKSQGWLAPTVLALIAAGSLALVYWARRSLRLPDPFLDLRLLARRHVAIANLAMVLLSLGTLQITFVFSAYVQSPAWTMVGLGLSATVAGLAKLPSNGLSIFAGPFSGWLSHKAGNRATLLLGTAMVTAGWLVATLLPSNIYQVVLLICVISFGTTILFAAIPNTMVSVVPVSRTGDVIGIMIVLRGLFIGIGAQLITLLLASDVVVHGKVSLPSGEGYRAVMLWIASLSALAAMLSLLLPGRSARHATPANVA